MKRQDLYVAVPWFQAAARDAIGQQALPELPAFAWLAARGEWSPAPQNGWRQWLLAQAGVNEPAAMLRRYPAGPCLAALASAGSEGVASWACAQPAHLAAAMDHLRLAASDLVLTAADAAELVQALNQHVADRGFSFATAVGGSWLMRCARAVDCVTHEPAEAAGQNVHDFMPAGLAGAQLRSLMNEIQMLLHEHPVNERRQRRGELTVNALWPWGFGAPLPAAVPGSAEAQALQGIALLTDDLWLRGVWQAHQAVAREWPTAMSEVTGKAAVAITRATTPDTARALATLDDELVSPLQARVVAGELSELQLFIGPQVLRLRSGARFRFWRRASANAARWLQ